MRLPVIVKVSAFALIVMGLYTWYANSIPQLESRPPVQVVLEEGKVTPGQLVRVGEEIYQGRGACEVCHSIGQAGTRAPDLAGIGARAAERAAGRATRGTPPRPGMTATEYLIEALTEPHAHQVDGYPPIMPAVQKPPIALNRSEIWALVAFLQSLGGTADAALADVPDVGPAPDAPAVAAVTLPGDPEAGRAVYTGKGACAACHKAGDIPGTPVGPDLSQIATIQTPDYIMEKVLDPRALGTVAGYPPGVMPATYGETLTAREFADLVAFLLTLE
jgi:mono/diheme cytochrome c family protein